MIDQEEAISLYRQALMWWGKDAQLWMAVEEGGEFLAALAQTIRGRDSNVIEEIADMKIMLEQMSIIFGEDQVEEERQRKLRRLKFRLESG